MKSVSQNCESVLFLCINYKLYNHCFCPDSRISNVEGLGDNKFMKHFLIALWRFD